jgi:muramoyltetrapeptide carboxypeptidase
MDIPTFFPQALRPGDTIGIIAPAGPVQGREAIDPALAMLEDWGFRVRFDNRIFDSYRYLAGQDSARAEELTRWFEDPSIRGIIALRGGFGSARIIPFLDEHRLRQNCKLFTGFSDLTTLHMYFRRRFGWVTIHGPMVTTLSRGALSPEAEGHLLSLWTDPQYLPTMSFTQLESWVPGSAEGRLVGGCLSILTASLGTNYEFRSEGKILFLEDRGEAPYRIDRMITQLRSAGKLDEVAGILLGRFTDCEPEEGGYSSRDVLRDLVTDLGVPVLANFPGGHGDDNWALPLGLRIQMDADQKHIQFLESAVLPG